MSRLSGRVTFPSNASRTDFPTSAHATTVSRLNGRVSFNGPSDATPQQVSPVVVGTDEVHVENINGSGTEAIRPRGRGNVRYQKLYEDKIETLERSEPEKKHRGKVDNQILESSNSSYQSKEFHSLHNGFASNARSQSKNSENSSSHLHHQNSTHESNNLDRVFQSVVNSPSNNHHSKPSEEKDISCRKRHDLSRISKSPNQKPLQGSKNRGRSPSEAHHQQLSFRKSERVENSLQFHELENVNDIIAQISNPSMRSDRSAAQIKRNIACSSNLIYTLTEDDWQQVCQSMVTTALDHHESEFIADLMVFLFKNKDFSSAMSDELMAVSCEHIMDDNDKPIPVFLSAILCAHWPKESAKAFSDINPILHTIVSVVKGWVLVLNEDNEVFIKSSTSLPTKENKAPEKITELAAEEPAVVNKCAIALTELCNAAQRNLWLKWMDLTNEIHASVKQSISYNKNITGNGKERLLEASVQLHQWVNSKKSILQNAVMQTDLK